MDGHVADGDVPKDRGAPGDELLGRRAFAPHDVVTCDHDSCADVFHSPVVEAHVLDNASPAPPALDANAVLCIDGGDVAGYDIPNAPGRLTSNRDCAVGVVYGAISDGHIFAGAIHAQSICVFTGLDHNSVVTGIDVIV